MSVRRRPRLQFISTMPKKTCSAMCLLTLNDGRHQIRTEGILKSDIRILEVEPFYKHEKAREPLKFGNVVVEETLFCHVRVRVENGRGEVADGWGAIFLMDMWGWPTPKVAHPDREEAMRRLNENFCRAAARYPGYAHPLDVFEALESDLAGMSKSVCAEMN